MSRTLAIDGGTPVRTSPLPYGRQQIDDADISAVTEALRSDWLTTGPTIGVFEEAFAQTVGAKHGVAVSNGTAALHTAAHAAGLTARDEVIVTPMTFAASANCVLYVGATPVFADVDPATLLLDPASVEAKITAKTKAIIAVDYAGQPCDYDALQQIADRHKLSIIDDACHAVGGSYKGRRVGSVADFNTFSFHPVKHLTTGEGGMITTDNDDVALKMRTFRNHGITTDHGQRAKTGSVHYEMVELGYNYRMTEFQAALGVSQLRHLASWVKQRRDIAQTYDLAFQSMLEFTPLTVRADVDHAYHLYVIQLDLEQLTVGRDAVIAALRSEGIMANLHYIPVHLHPYYRATLGVGPGTCPIAENAFTKVITLPLFPAMTDSDTNDVIEAVRKVMSAYKR